MHYENNGKHGFIRKFSFIFSSFIACLFFSSLGIDFLAQANQLKFQIKDNFGVSVPASRAMPNFRKIAVRIGNTVPPDSSLRNYLREIYPLINDRDMDKILSAQTLNDYTVKYSAGTREVYASLYIPEYYLDPSPKMLWELNVAEFKSRFYQIYRGDTILVDTWDCSVGDPKTRTYPGYYRALKIRNWPSWKNPEDDSPPVPPGSYNPLGLFSVHFDKHSTRQFHGTNLDNPQINVYGAVSHGCIRNNNDNIARLKEFMIKKIIKSADLSSWLMSKKTMAFEMKDEDELPIKIIYRTFNVDKDEKGDYIEFFEDAYGYENRQFSEMEDTSLITLTTVQNVLGELRKKVPSIVLSDERLIPILAALIADHEYFQKYYFREIPSVMI